MHHVLIVANQTVGGDALAALVLERAAKEETAFHLVVPIHHHRPAPSTATIRPPSDRVVAHQRLAYGIEWLEGLGVVASGEVAEDESVNSFTEVIARRPVDEVVVSTLQSSLSRWLKIDLPSRIGRHVNVPVTVVSARD
jgi:hypothetical protein